MRLGKIINENFALSRDVLDDIYRQLDMCFAGVNIDRFSTDYQYRELIIDEFRHFVLFQKIAMNLEWISLSVSLNFAGNYVDLEFKAKAPINVIPCECIYRISPKRI